MFTNLLNSQSAPVTPSPAHFAAERLVANQATSLEETRTWRRQRRNQRRNRA
jgi:hypothetical protein